MRVWRVLLYARAEQVTGSVWYLLESRDLVFVTRDPSLILFRPKKLWNSSFGGLPV